MVQVADPLEAHLPQLEQMRQALEAEDYESLYELYSELDMAFGSLYGTYVEELQYLAADEPANQVAEKIGESFAEIRPLLSALRDDLSLEEFGEAQETLNSLKDECVTLYSLFGRYREVALSGPRYSDIPYTHELVRVCFHYLDGALSIEAVQGRLDAFCQYHEALEQQISTLIPSPPERATFERRAEDLEEALQIQLQGIEDLDFALERQDEEGIKEALDSLTEASEVFLEIYHQLQQADLQPRTVGCIRCGADNSIESKICGECGAVLPQSAAVVDSPTSTIALEEDGSVVGPQESEELAKLRAAVDTALHGGDAQELHQTVADYGKKLARSRRQFERMDAPPQDLPTEQVVILQRARTAFSEALKELESGFTLLREGAEDLDYALLNQGLETMEQGSSLFVEFQTEFERAQQLSS